MPGHFLLEPFQYNDLSIQAGAAIPGRNAQGNALCLMTHRDSNQGACTNSCRWEYNAHAAQETESGDIIATEMVHPQDVDRPVLLQEKNRPGEYMPAYEDEHGTYIMNSRDLRAVQHVERLVNMGIHSLKIEGRTKSHCYVARTAQVYRTAIDNAVAGRPFDMGLMSQLEHLANRGYTEGFYRRHVPSEYQNYDVGHSVNPDEAPGSGHIVSIPLSPGHGVAADGGHALLMRYRQPK